MHIIIYKKRGKIIMDKKDILKQIDLCLEYYQCSILFDRYNIQQSIGFENLDKKISNI